MRFLFFLHPSFSGTSRKLTVVFSWLSRDNNNNKMLQTVFLKTNAIWKWFQERLYKINVDIQTCDPTTRKI